MPQFFEAMHTQNGKKAPKSVIHRRKVDPARLPQVQDDTLLALLKNPLSNWSSYKSLVQEGETNLLNVISESLILMFPALDAIPVLVDSIKSQYLNEGVFAELCVDFGLPTLRLSGGKHDTHSGLCDCFICGKEASNIELFKAYVGALLLDESQGPDAVSYLFRQVLECDCDYIEESIHQFKTSPVKLCPDSVLAVVENHFEEPVKEFVVDQPLGNVEPFEDVERFALFVPNDPYDSADSIEVIPTDDRVEAVKDIEDTGIIERITAHNGKQLDNTLELEDIKQMNTNAPIISSLQGNCSKHVKQPLCHPQNHFLNTQSQLQHPWCSLVDLASTGIDIIRDSSPFYLPAVQDPRLASILRDPTMHPKAYRTLESKGDATVYHLVWHVLWLKYPDEEAIPSLINGIRTWFVRNERFAIFYERLGLCRVAGMHPPVGVGARADFFECYVGALMLDRLQGPDAVVRLFSYLLDGERHFIERRIRESKRLRKPGKSLFDIIHGIDKVEADRVSEEAPQEGKGYKPMSLLKHQQILQNRSGSLRDIYMRQRHDYSRLAEMVSHDPLMAMKTIFYPMKIDFHCYLWMVSPLGVQQW